jgi:hypothetical protein
VISEDGDELDFGLDFRPKDDCTNELLDTFAQFKKEHSEFLVVVAT